MRSARYLCETATYSVHVWDAALLALLFFRGDGGGKVYECGFYITCDDLFCSVLRLDEIYF